MKRTLRIDEVAEELRVTARTVQRWLKSGELESIKIGGTRRIFIDAIEKKSDGERHSATPSDIRRG